MIKMVNESLKDELIDKLMNTVYIKGYPEYENWSIEYLQSLTLEELDQLLSDYYMYDIQRREN